MTLRSKIGAYVAAVAVALAIGAAPASASTTSPTLPDASTLGAYCKTVKDPKLAAACNQGVAAYASCATKPSSAQVACLMAAAQTIAGSKVTLPADLSSILKGLTGGSLGGLNLQSLLGLLNGGGKIGGVNLASLLGALKH